MDLDPFLPIDDFTVALTDDNRVEFVSESRGRLAWFPAWEHADRDLRHFAAVDVPFGTIDEPFIDEDEGWSVRIFEHAGWVYIAEGKAMWRVPRDDYFRGWAALIVRFNRVMSLEDLFE